jgi:hypothetical protein
MNWLEHVTLEGKFIRLEPLNPELHAPSMFEGFDSQSTNFLSRGESIQSVEDLQRHLEGINAIPNRINWAIRVLESIVWLDESLFPTSNKQMVGSRLARC